VVRSPNGERAHRRGARAAPRARSLRRRSSAARSRSLRRVRGRGERKNEARVCVRPASAVLFGREPRAAVGFRWTAHTHRTEFQPRQDETFPAQAQVAAWSAGRAERERAAGLISISGHMAAWHGERGLRASRPWAGFGFGAASRPGAWGEFRASGPWAVFHLRAEFRSEQ
jgi:hypothetical protein